MHPQDQHIKSGQHRIEVVVVKHRIVQVIQVVQRPHRLRQFFVQTVAHLLRAGIRGGEDRGAVTVAQAGPIGLRAAVAGLKLGPAGNAGPYDVTITIERDLVRVEM